MHAITIALADCPAPWTLLFHKREDAQTSWKLYLDCAANGEVVLHDDFGQTALVQRSRVAGTLLEDLDKSMLAHIERGLHNARTQAKAQQLAMNDPILKTAAMTRGAGPAIFNPVGNGGMHG